MSRAPSPINRDPSGFVYDGQRLVGFLFDTSAGTVATLPDRIPLGTFADWKAARTAIREAGTETVDKSGTCAAFAASHMHAHEASP